MIEVQVKKLSVIVSRFFAFLIDSVLIAIIFFFFYTKVIQAYELKFLVVALSIFLFFEFYFFLFELLFGWTIGKLIFGLRVKSIQSEKNISPTKYFLNRIFNLFIRNFSRILIFIPPLFLLNEILILFFFKGHSFSELITNLRVEFRNH